MNIIAKQKHCLIIKQVLKKTSLIDDRDMILLKGVGETGKKNKDCTLCCRKYSKYTDNVFKVHMDYEQERNKDSNWWTKTNGTRIEHIM